MAISREKALDHLKQYDYWIDGGYSWIDDVLNKAISDMEKLQEYQTKLTNAYGECDTLLDVVVDGLVKQAEEHKIGQPRKARLLTDDDVDLWEQSKKDREKLQKIEEGKTDFEELERKMCRYFNEVDMSAEKTELERLALDIVCIGMQTMGCLNGILESEQIVKEVE